MSDEQLLRLTRNEAWAAGGLTWCKWITAQPGKYANEADALQAAKTENANRVRDLFHYGVSPNRNGGWDVTAASCDG